MDKKNQLLDLLERSQQNELRFIAGLTEKEGAVSGTVQDWAVKDEVAHVAAWKAIMSDRCRAFMTNEEPRDYSDVDAVNDELFNHFKDYSWQEVQDFHEHSYHELYKQVRLMEEYDLHDGQRYDWLRGRSLWRRTVHTGYFHPQGHIAFYFSQHGDKESGNQLMEEVTKTLMILDDLPVWQGRAIYNLACYYALIGEKVIAIEKLGEAFPLSPDMIEWSKKDTDLDSIREEPGYHALVKGDPRQE